LLYKPFKAPRYDLHSFCVLKFLCSQISNYHLVLIMSKTKSAFPWMGVALVINFLLVFALAVFVFRTQKTKVVYFDAVKLLSEYQGIKDAKLSTEARSAAMKANLDTLRTEFEVAQQKAQQAKGSTKEKLLLTNIAEAKQAQFFKFQDAVGQQIQAEEKKAMDAVLAGVNETIATYAKEKGYDIVLTGTQLGNIAYGNVDVNITDDLLQLINNKYKRGAK
jgi:outer membrane protein